MTEIPPAAPLAHAPRITDLMHGRFALTPVTVLLVGLNLAAFAAMLLNGGGFWHRSEEHTSELQSH